MLIDETLWVTETKQADGTIRWMAPELLSGSQGTVTKESDIFALAMTFHVGLTIH
jgi:serine/threonine protein kinase